MVAQDSRSTLQQLEKYSLQEQNTIMSTDHGINGVVERKINLPTITLDQTLAGLYRQHCPSLSTKRIAHIFSGTTCAADLSPDFPRNRKYIYQDSAFNDANRSQKSDSEVQRALAPKYLSLVPQRDAFIAGDAPVIFFHSGSSEAEIKHDRDEADRTLAQLDERQKPDLIFCAGPGEITRVVEDHGIDALTSKLVVDGVAASVGSKMLTSGDVQWYINSKAGLAKSGLPTPEAEMVEVEGHCPSAYSCCDACNKAAQRDGMPLVSKECTGRRNKWLGEQSQRILSAVERQLLPFVFKNQQTFGGAGTYVVTKEPSREQLLRDMTEGGILRRMLSYISSENEHLHAGTVLLTKMIEDPVADYGVTFFVDDSGSAVYLATSEQMIDRETHSWIGSTISFAHQADLQSKFGQLIDRVGTWLHKQGYVGPAGVDILETKSGEFEIVDMNVRTSGSLCLPLLQTHFTSRGLHWASSSSVTVSESRRGFCEQWRAELESGHMCIVAWYEDGNVGKSYGDIVVGAEDEATLAQILDSVRQVSESVTF